MGVVVIDERFVILAAILSFIGGLSYLRDTIRGKTKPNRVSWFIWAAAPLIAFSAELSHGVGLAALMTFMVGFNPLLIFLGSFVNRKSVWKLTRLDIICGALAVAGLALWQISGSGNVAILFGILADGLAAIPTVVKAYKEPASENWHVFAFGAVSAGITMLTLGRWDLAHAGFPVYIFGICLLLVALIKFQPGFRQRLALEHVASSERGSRLVD